MKKLTLALFILAAHLQAFSQQQSLPRLVKSLGANKNPAWYAVEFNGRHYSSQQGLYCSDGTDAGSFSLYSGGVACLTVMNGKLYFIGNDGNGRELWVSDGTATGTSMVKDINPAGNGVYQFSWDNAMVVMNNNLYFYGFDGSNGIELWKSDGTAQGTQMVMDVNPGPGSAIDTGTSSSVTPPNESLLAVNNKVFFSADDGVHGGELWVTDGSTAGTSLVMDLQPANTYPYPPDNFKRFNNQVVFFAFDNAGVNVFISDGTASGTVNILPHWGGWYNGYTVDNNKLYFFADTASGMGINTKLFVSDGTAGGTQALKEVYPHDINTARWGFLTAFNNKLYFSAAPSGPIGSGEAELWVSDGTAAGTQLFKDLVATSFPSQPSQLTVFNGKLYLRARDTSGRNEIWESDGTDLGTKKVPYVNQDAKISNITGFVQNRSPLTRVGNSLFFWNYYGTNDHSALYKIDQFPDAVNEIAGANTLDIYPNPVQNELHFSRPVENIAVHTLDGKRVFHSAKQAAVIDIGSLPAASYLVTAEAEDGAQLNKLIIKQ